MHVAYFDDKTTFLNKKRSFFKQYKKRLINFDEKYFFEHKEMFFVDFPKNASKHQKNLV